MLNKIAEKQLSEAKKARTQLSKNPGIIVHHHDNEDKGIYLSNFAKCLLNRQIDIFDDSIFLLENGRIQSACTISRGMIETYAFAKFLNCKVEKILSNNEGQKSVKDAVIKILKFTNSSRFKETEQKKIKEGIFSIENYHFTEEAKIRMHNMLAGSEHVMNALRDLYQEEIKHTKLKESQLEQTYDILSEWVHPSQISIFINYVPESHRIPTSQGVVHIHDGAKSICVQALHLITDSMNQYKWSLQLAEIMTNRSRKH